MNKRIQQMYRAWYQDQRRYSMRREEWIYIGSLFLASIIAFGLGLFIGWIWVLLI